MKNTIETASYPQGSHLNGSRRFRMRVCRAGLCNNPGQSLVEFALTLPLFILILVATAEFARVAWSSIEVSNAARAGVQYAAQSNTTAADTVGIAAAVSNDGTNLSGLTSTTSYSCACATAASSTTITCSTALTACAAPSTIAVYVQVTTKATVTPLFHYPGLPATFNLQGYAQMEVE